MAGREAASLLSDNAAVFTARSRGGKVLLELETERLGILFEHSTPYHPQTCGKVERFHQTLKRFLRKQPAVLSRAELQFQLDAYLGRLRHIPVGTAHKNRKVRLLVAGSTSASSPTTAS